MSPPCYTHKNFSSISIFLCAEESQRQTRDHIQSYRLKDGLPFECEVTTQRIMCWRLGPPAAVLRDGHLRNDCIIKAVTLSKGQFTSRHHWWWLYCEVAGWGGGSQLEGQDGMCLWRLSPGCGAPSLRFPLWFSVSPRGSAPLYCYESLLLHGPKATEAASYCWSLWDGGESEPPLFNLSSQLHHSKRQAD